MAEGMMGNPMGAQQPPMEQPMNTQMGGTEDAVLDMHLTEDVKKALQAKGVDISSVADRGPQEPVVVLPISIIMQRYPSDSPENSMKEFVMDMTSANQQPVSTEQPMVAPAEAPAPEGLGAPTMDRPPMTA